MKLPALLAAAPAVTTTPGLVLVLVTELALDLLVEVTVPLWELTIDDAGVVDEALDEEVDVDEAVYVGVQRLASRVKVLVEA